MTHSIDTHVTLHVRSSDQEGYTAVQVRSLSQPPGAPARAFYYRFSGGNRSAGDGSFEFPADGQTRHIRIDLDAPSDEGCRYSIAQLVPFLAEPPGSALPDDFRVEELGDDHLVVTDSDADVMSGEYTVRVRCWIGGSNYLQYWIPCDPPWENRPR